MQDKLYTYRHLLLKSMQCGLISFSILGRGETKVDLDWNIFKKDENEVADGSEGSV